MDPNQDDQNSQNPQTPTGDGNGAQAPVGGTMPGDQAPVGDIPSEGSTGEVAPPPPIMGGDDGGAAVTPPPPTIGSDGGAADAPMGGDSDQPSSDGGSEPTV